MTAKVLRLDVRRHASRIGNLFRVRNRTDAFALLRFLIPVALVVYGAVKVWPHLWDRRTDTEMGTLSMRLMFAIFLLAVCAGECVRLTTRTARFRNAVLRPLQVSPNVLLHREVVRAMIVALVSGILPILPLLALLTEPSRVPWWALAGWLTPGIIAGQLGSIGALVWTTALRSARHFARAAWALSGGFLYLAMIVLVFGSAEMPAGSWIARLVAHAPWVSPQTWWAAGTQFPFRLQMLWLVVAGLTWVLTRTARWALFADGYSGLTAEVLTIAPSGVRTSPGVVRAIHIRSPWHTLVLGAWRRARRWGIAHWGALTWSTIAGACAIAAPVWMARSFRLNEVTAPFALSTTALLAFSAGGVLSIALLPVAGFGEIYPVSYWGVVRLLRGSLRQALLAGVLPLVALFLLSLVASLLVVAAFGASASQMGTLAWGVAVGSCGSLGMLGISMALAIRFNSLEQTFGRVLLLLGSLSGPCLPAWAAASLATDRWAVTTLSSVVRSGGVALVLVATGFFVLEWALQRVEWMPAQA